MQAHRQLRHSNIPLARKATSTLSTAIAAPCDRPAQRKRVKASGSPPLPGTLCREGARRTHAFEKAHKRGFWRERGDSCDGEWCRIGYLRMRPSEFSLELDSTLLSQPLSKGGLL